MNIAIRFGEQLKKLIKNAQVFVYVITSMFSYSAFADFGRDCKLVGNYIHDNASQVYDALYVKYNGIGIRKKETFEGRYNSFAWRANRKVGYGIEERSNYYKDFFEENYNYLVNNNQEQQVLFDNNLKENFKLDFKTEEKLFTFFYAHSFCKKLSHKKARKCRQNIKELFNLTQIQQIWPYTDGPTTSLSLPHIIKKILTSADHLKLSIETLKPLLDKALVQDYEMKGNIKSLLKEKAGTLTYLSQKEQDELVWDSLAYYATRGASPEGYAKNLANAQTIYSFSTHFELFNLMHVFDSQKVSGENLFSLPEVKKNSCIVGKPYHFWMSAYLARDLVKKKISKKQAFFATAAVGVLYDFMGSGAAQRERIRIYQEPLDSIYTMSIQQSLIYKIVGAYYGAVGSEKLEIDMDELYQIVKDNQIKKGQKIYKTITHFKNLNNFLDHTAIDLVISHLADKL